VIIAAYSFFFIPFSEPVPTFFITEPKGSPSLVLTAAPSPALAVPITGEKAKKKPWNTRNTRKSKKVEAVEKVEGGKQAGIMHKE
jgi:hypothetical protein